MDPYTETETARYDVLEDEPDPNNNVFSDELFFDNPFLTSVKELEPLEQVQEKFQKHIHGENYLELLERVHQVLPWDLEKEGKKEYVDKLLLWLYQTLLEKGVSLSTLVEIACKTNMISTADPIPILEMLYQYAQENVIEFPVYEKIISTNVHVPFLQWWKDKLPSDFEIVLKYEDDLKETAYMKWICQSGFQITLDKELLEGAPMLIDPEIVQLLHGAGVKIPESMIEGPLSLIAAEDPDIFDKGEEYVKNALDWLFQEYEAMVTDILMRDGVDLDTGHCIADESGENYFLLRYLHARGVPFNYTNGIVDSIQNMEQAKFWEESGLPIKHTSGGLIDCLIWDVELGKWWFKHGLSYDNVYCIDRLINNCAVASAQFLVDQGIGITHTEKGLDKCYKITEPTNQPAVLAMIQWMIENGLELKYTDVFIDKCLQKQLFQVLDFCYEHGNFPTEKEFTKGFFSKRAVKIDLALEWWLRHDLKVILSKNLVECALDNGDVRKLLEEHGYVIEGESKNKSSKTKKSLKKPSKRTTKGRQSGLTPTVFKQEKVIE